jgi:hypothetical protein
MQQYCIFLKKKQAQKKGNCQPIMSNTCTLGKHLVFIVMLSKNFPGNLMNS